MRGTILWIVASVSAAMAAPQKPVYEFLEAFGSARSTPPEAVAAGMAALALIQGRAILHAPSPDAPVATEYSVALPKIETDERLSLAFAYGLSTPPDDLTRPQIRRGINYILSVEGEDMLNDTLNTPDWASRAFDLTKHAGKTVNIAFRSVASVSIAPNRVAWVKPAIFRHPATGPMRIEFYPAALQYDFADVTFGPTDTQRFLERRLDNLAEGKTSFEFIDGVACATPSRKPGHHKMLYFSFSPEFTKAGDWGNFAVYLDYFDLSTGNVVLEYDSFDPTIRALPQVPGAFKRHPRSISLSRTNKKKTEVFILQDGWFDKGCNETDFRLMSSNLFYISRVRVSKMYPDYEIRDNTRKTERFNRRHSEHDTTRARHERER